MIICVVGLPGSGKTWYAKNVLHWDYLVDDPKSVDDFPSIEEHERIVICDPLLCAALYEDRLRALYPGHDIEYIFFENNVQKCLKNIQFRNDDRHVHITLMNMAKQYTIPDGVVPLEIWSPK